MPLVAVALLGGERRGGPPGTALVLPLVETADHRHHVAVAELSQGVGSESRAGPAGAVDDDVGVVVDDPALHLALEVASRDMDGPRQGALLELVGLAHVEHHRARLLDVGSGVGGVDLAYAGLGIA